MATSSRRIFSSLAVPNYRHYFYGQLVSLTGTWMQTVGEMWLVIDLSGSGFSAGLTAALQYLPVFLLGPWGGVLADRMSKRRLLAITQVLMATPSLILWLLVLSNAATLWSVYLLVFLRGMVNAVDNPTRQSFAVELVGRDRIVNAVSLNAVLTHSSSLVGPAAAGGVIALVGVGTCFLLNALSFVVMLVALTVMDPSSLWVPKPSSRRMAAELRASFLHVVRTPQLLIPTVMMGAIGAACFNTAVQLPLLARFTWEGSAGTFAVLSTALGLGSIGGALIMGSRHNVGGRLIVGSAASLGCTALLVATAPTMPLQAAALTCLGAISVAFAASVSSVLQLASAPYMRGQLMAIFAVVFLGSRAFGGPLVGGIAQSFSPRASFAFGALVALAVAAVAAVIYLRIRGDRLRLSSER